jgi:hypothetical protein
MRIESRSSGDLGMHATQSIPELSIAAPEVMQPDSSSRDDQRSPRPGERHPARALGDRLSITRRLRAQPESCVSLMFLESRKGQFTWAAEVNYELTTL